ncbi:type II toxin-antitoxin system RelE/ParE family toxin [Rhizobium sp.]|uniref:type II toxin-antitoxin system RelE/ParE family toxin n=1 Tax=Rhizobium sp. TaxID=391 RepID=UPI0028AF77A6
MSYRIIYTPETEAELDTIYDHIAAAAGTRIAGDFVDGIITFIEGLQTFPARGTIRESSIPNLRIIGYRHSVSIAFVVQGNEVVILGVFRRGQNITSEILKARLL